MQKAAGSRRDDLFLLGDHLAGHRKFQVGGAMTFFFLLEITFFRGDQRCERQHHKVRARTFSQKLLGTFEHFPAFMQKVKS